MNPGFRIWLSLPDFTDPPNASYIIVQWVLLLAVSCQRRVFVFENMENAEHEGGDNSEIPEDELNSIRKNKVPDFFINTK